MQAETKAETVGSCNQRHRAVPLGAYNCTKPDERPHRGPISYGQTPITGVMRAEVQRACPHCI